MPSARSLTPRGKLYIYAHALTWRDNKMQIIQRSRARKNRRRSERVESSFCLQLPSNFSIFIARNHGVKHPFIQSSLSLFLSLSPSSARLHPLLSFSPARSGSAKNSPRSLPLNLIEFPTGTPSLSLLFRAPQSHCHCHYRCHWPVRASADATSVLQIYIGHFAPSPYTALEMNSGACLCFLFFFTQRRPLSVLSRLILRLILYVPSVRLICSFFHLCFSLCAAIFPGFAYFVFMKF